MPIGEYKNMTRNDNIYTDEEWMQVKMQWKHHRVWGIRVAMLSDDASRTREPLCRLTAWLADRDLIASPLPVIAMVLLFCAVVTTAVAVYVMFS